VLVHELAEIVVIANGVRAGRTTPLAATPIDPAASHSRAAPVGAPS
jgi:cation-transporting P-type ATPase G